MLNYDSREREKANNQIDRIQFTIFKNKKILRQIKQEQYFRMEEIEMINGTGLSVPTDFWVTPPWAKFGSSFPHFNFKLQKLPAEFLPYSPEYKEVS